MRGSTEVVTSSRRSATLSQIWDKRFEELETLWDEIIVQEL
jgi:hypothetical protein